MSAPSVEFEVGWGSFERETVLDAFCRNPGSTWTAAGLSSWYRIRIDLVRAILSEFAEERIICRPLGQPDHYTLSDEGQRPANGLGLETDPPEGDEIDLDPHPDIAEPYGAVTVDGGPRGLLGLANQQHADAIVVGRRGRGGLASLSWGASAITSSTTRRVR